MEDKHHHGNSSGFLAGVIVGVVITLLFTTKKGREIFKDTINKALDKFSDLQNKIEEEVVYDDEDEEGNDYVKPEPDPKEKPKEVRYIASETENEVTPEKPAESEARSERPAPAKAKPEHVEEKHEEAKHHEVTQEKEELQPEAPKKTSSVRKFFKLKKS